MSDTERVAPANWFIDPDDPKQLRYWDGASWTDQRQPNVNYVAPVGKRPVMNWTARIAAALGFLSLLINPFSLVAAGAIICGIIGLTRSKEIAPDGDPRGNAGLAITGIVVGAIGFLGTALLKGFLF